VGAINGFAEEILRQKQHERKAEHLHGRFHNPAAKEGRKSRECNGAINHIHDRSAEADVHRPFEATPRAFR